MTSSANSIRTESVIRKLEELGFSFYQDSKKSRCFRRGTDRVYLLLRFKTCLRILAPSPPAVELPAPATCRQAHTLGVHLQKLALRSRCR